MPFDNSKDEMIVSPYSKLASIYDDVMSHVDYKLWARYIQKVIKKWNPDARTILDISCGTGSFLAKLDVARHQLFGFDLSFEMIFKSKTKNHCLKHQLQLWCGDMQSFVIQKKVDVVVCLYDSINYLLSFDEWTRCFDCVFESLNDQGIFIFDICTEKNSFKYFRNYIEKQKRNEYQYLRESQYNCETRIHSNRFIIDFNSDARKYVEIHQQYIFPLNEVMNFISKSKFDLLSVYDGFTLRQANKNSLRVHFILKKNST